MWNKLSKIQKIGTVLFWFFGSIVLVVVHHYATIYLFRVG